MEYAHKGVTITFSQSDAKFSASIGGKYKASTSLSAIKKAIDNAEKNAFQCFDALTKPGYESREKGINYTACKVIGVTVESIRRGSWRTPTHKWLLEGGREAERARRDAEEARIRAMSDEIQCHRFPEAK